MYVSGRSSMVPAWVLDEWMKNSNFVIMTLIARKFKTHSLSHNASSRSSGWKKTENFLYIMRFSQMKNIEWKGDLAERQIHHFLYEVCLISTMWCQKWAWDGFGIEFDWNFLIELWFLPLSFKILTLGLVNDVQFKHLKLRLKISSLNFRILNFYIFFNEFYRSH